MKMILKLIGILILLPLVYVIGVILLGQLTYYSPKDVESINNMDKPHALSDSSFTELIWNIGYAGLGKDMDFFFDEGKQVRCTKVQHQTYFDGVEN
ncbi:MAG: endonuclease/exonuclease/phosphatase family protein, partial [Saprospiraceae bacterium]|nr:endonuclease/exonuclease/phosphatase family protein [Saprospiraceae bacterium]